MIENALATIDHLSIHRVGNQENGVLEISQDRAVLDESVLELLSTYFLRPFKTPEYYHINTANRPLLNAIKTIFEEPESRHQASMDIAELLHGASQNPAIKTGEVFVVLFRDCLLEDELVDVVGLFKSENKDTFLKVYPENEGFGVGADQGININKLDKGALIYHSEEEEGYVVQVVDQTNAQEAQYWKEVFLKLTAREDSYHNTHQYIQMCRDFALEEMQTDNRGEQLGLVNEAVTYFKENDHFDKEEFQRQVIREPEIIEAFEGYSKSYELENHLNSINDFDISPQAVRYSKRFVRSVIKLDKNFHIYVHGSRDRIKKGFDEERGLNFYQVYYDSES